MKQVTIIGGLGFLGSHIAARLLEEECVVTAVDTLEKDEPTQRLIEMSVGRHAHYTFVQESAKNLQQSSSCHMYIYAAKNDETSDICSFVGRLEEKDHLLFLSSTDVYVTVEKTKEQKWRELEALLTKSAKERAFSLTLMRLPTVYGLHQPFDLIMDENKPLVQYKNTIKQESEMDLLYIDDVVEAMYRALSLEKGIYSFHIGSGREKPWGESTVHTKPGLSNQEAETILGFKPHISIKEGISRYKEEEKKWQQSSKKFRFD